ncbi:hypothetical protein [Listeria sp. PSOL-1]|uniref:hypothetical protein n=1 Tax=Listeria sp. PSOL-1 TaxID=1844999 RepID=UPI0013D1405B|nr:hypothetical protein [Listeria sp. PSOL-1]
MANYINKEKRNIDFDPYRLEIVALPEVVAVNYQPISSNALLIRIADVDGNLKPLRDPKRYQAILELYFNDINERDDYWGLSAKEKAEMKLFNQKHCEVIYRFIDHYPNWEQIVVHCHAGVSRSSAVAMGIAEHYQQEKILAQLKQVERYLPNPRVLAIMRGEAFI